jgi:hypothetical protein
VLNATADEALIAFEPEAGAAVYTFYFMPYTYQGGDGGYRVEYARAGSTTLECPVLSSAGAVPVTTWLANNGTRRSSLVSPSSPAAAAGAYYATNAPWKTVDGRFNFSTRTPAEACTDGGGDVCEGYDGDSGVEQIVFDFGDCVRVDGFALWAVGDNVHDPHTMSLAVANSTDAGAAAWVTVHAFVGAANTSERQAFDFSAAAAAVARSSRFWRWTIVDRCCGRPQYQAYVREVQFRASAPGAVRAVGGGGNRAWVAQHRLFDTPAGVTAAMALPQLPVTNYTARTEWDRFRASEVRATAAETAAALAPAVAAGAVAELFLARRTEPVRMFDALPLYWAKTARPDRHVLADTAHVGEYYVFQVGVYALHDLEVVGFVASGADNVSCFSLGGTNFHGGRFAQTHPVNASTVGALTFGLPIPAAAAAATGGTGQLQVNITLQLATCTGSGTGRSTAATDSSVPVAVRLKVTDEPLVANGTTDSWRMARMAWLDSTQGMSLEPSAQFGPLATDAAARTVTLSGNRTLTLGPNGLPSALTSRGQQILAGPVVFAIGGAPPLAPTAAVELRRLGPGLAVWRAVMASAPPAEEPWEGGASPAWRVEVRGSCTYDGYIDLNVTLHCGPAAGAGQHRGKPPRAAAPHPPLCESAAGVELTVPVRAAVAQWFMGLSAASGSWPPRLLSGGGRQGSTGRTRNVGFAWQQYSARRPRMQAWLGTPAAGLRIKLKGTEDAWNSPIELPDDTATMTNLSWGSCTTVGAGCSSRRAQVCCAGLINVSQTTPTAAVVFSASTGPVRLAAGESKPYMLDLLVTPSKLVNTSQHFGTRYYHFGGQFPPPNRSMDAAVDAVLAQNATWLNIHQGSNLNLYIDYPLRSAFGSLRFSSVLFVSLRFGLVAHTPVGGRYGRNSTRRQRGTWCASECGGGASVMAVVSVNVVVAAVAVVVVAAVVSVFLVVVLVKCGGGECGGGVSDGGARPGSLLPSQAPAWTRLRWLRCSHHMLGSTA